MSKIWITSDTHFNHKKLGFDNPGKTEEYIQKWNSRVEEEDTVIHLGDVIFSRPSEIMGIMDQLNGTKILIRGNHDKAKDRWYRNRGFSIVLEFMFIDSYIFSHKPLPGWVLWLSNKINIHGHLHTHGKSHRKGGGTKRHVLIPERAIVELEHLNNL